MLAPPFVITETEIAELVRRFTAALERTAHRVLGSALLRNTP
jgi:adenosylmethionine-8-amino-7-oxononanoate aminotransferase